MFIDFGQGKCPLCGDFGRVIESDVYHCQKCIISFNDFYISKHATVENAEDSKFWN